MKPKPFHLAFQGVGGVYQDARLAQHARQFRGVVRRQAAPPLSKFLSLGTLLDLFTFMFLLCKVRIRIPISRDYYKD